MRLARDAGDLLFAVRDLGTISSKSSKFDAIHGTIWHGLNTDLGTILSLGFNVVQYTFPEHGLVVSAAKATEQHSVESMDWLEVYDWLAKSSL